MKLRISARFSAGMVVVLASAMSPMLANAKLAVQGQAGIVVPLAGVAGSGVMAPGQVAPLTVAITSRSGRRHGLRLRSGRNYSGSLNRSLNSRSGRRLGPRLRGRRHLGGSAGRSLNSANGRRHGLRLRSGRNYSGSLNRSLNSRSGRRRGVFLRGHRGRR